jgi:arylsulfatase A-like enzyme
METASVSGSRGSILAKTFPETLIKKFGLQKKDVVVFSSWAEMKNAASSVKETPFFNTGNKPVFDPVTHQADPIMAKINRQQAVDHKQKNEDRYDKYTFAQAMHYLKKYQPKFMWIALQDTDEASHEGLREEYYQALSFYDTAINELFTALRELKIDKNTLVIVTADYSHGNKKKRVTSFESKQIWAFVFNGKLKPIKQDVNGYHYSNLSIRPAIEAVF